ncbi:hypothetical protein [Demequina litorisediminis]|uniref:Uncharacterized protein n=1 Tax=Demequina litorisediminis TaxID=1849022 RepID=A0ABQ6IKM8_9MICO|nr:hypothetical protein [Demequina litorisediminis]GMA37651.1 hypothetical protein GCM10025876_38550 [Demequina litorisediminis]
MFEEKRSRFAAEFGWQAPAAWPTLARGVGGSPDGPTDPAVHRLQKHPEGMAALARGIGDHVPHLPTDGKGWYFTTHHAGARDSRGNRPFPLASRHLLGCLVVAGSMTAGPPCRGRCSTSRASARLGWHASAQVMAPRAVIITADGTATGLTLVNDLPEAWVAPLTVRVVDEAGSVLVEDHRDVTVPSDGHWVIEPSSIPAGAAAVVVDAGGVRGTRWIVPDLELSHPTARIELSDVRVDGEVATLRFTAVTLVRDLVLLAEVDEALADATITGQL